MRRLVCIVTLLVLTALFPAALMAQTASPIDPEALPVLIGARSDLELLANLLLGTERPVGWSGSLDVNNPQLPILIRLDLELLAGTTLGADQRPAGWFGAVPSTPFAIARDIRHDLELLADTAGQPNVRPMGWAGDDPLMRCARSLQTLVSLLERGGVFQLTVDVNSPNFCGEAEAQATQFAETNLLGNTGPSAVTSEPQAVASGQAAPSSVQVDELSPAFLNRFATEQTGVIPVGTTVTPVARSYTQFSRMMLVRGEGFEVFVDYQSTSLTDEQFSLLPDVDIIGSAPVCSADWCSAPAG